MKSITAPSMHSVFVYGSLMSDDVVLLLLRRLPPTTSAILPDFHRFSIKGRVYPAILPAESDKVSGKVLFGITDDELKVLDEFEDTEYVRNNNVHVLLTTEVACSIHVGRGLCSPNSEDNSEKLQAKTYVWANKDDHDLYGTWDFEEWEQHHKEGFLQMTKEFAQEMNNLPVSET